MIFLLYHKIYGIYKIDKLHTYSKGKKEKEKEKKEKGQ